MMLWLLLLQVLASCLWLGHSEVVPSFADCQQFFYAGTPPNDALHPKNPAWICQRYHNFYRYATLYDRDRRIPVYSAYKYQPGCRKRPHTWLFVEPQLINKNSFNEMEREHDLIEYYNFTSDQIKESQAVGDDYKNMAGFDRGQLNPSCHHNTTDSKTATFTLTNAVPIDSSLYTGDWSNYESETMPIICENCTATYVIMGAVPGNTYVIEGRVNVPSHIWSAACCLVGTEPRKTWGAIAENDKNQVEILSLRHLEDRLTTLHGGRVTLFKNACS